VIKKQIGSNTDYQLSLDDSRRLTGKNLLSDHSGAIIDTFVNGVDKALVVKYWRTYISQLFTQLHWQDQSSYYRIFENGISMAISAPLDVLYAACEINEAAWAFTCAKISKTANKESITQTVKRIKQYIKDEANPHLLALISMAKQKNITYLVDDDEFSLGYGASCQTWPISALPKIDEINWQQYYTIPIALITGTNGKSTSVRIMSQIIKQVGRCCGVTSTDFIKVGDDIIEHGDYSGPAGARMLLRHANTEAAILEVARGGILRRGLPIEHVDAALITNIAADHLGQYGINTVTELTEVKAVVAKALTNKNTLVLNADDQHLVTFFSSLSAKKKASSICWFSLNEHNPVLLQHKENGYAVCFVRAQQLIYCNKKVVTELIAINNMPMTLNGAAQHNVQNALGCIGLAKALCIDNNSIIKALKLFSSNNDDNPGRGNQFSVNGAKVIIDFAHNVHSMDAMAATTANMPAKRRFLMLSHAGDRSDQEIKAMTISAMAMQPDVLVIAELEAYLRGRQRGEVPKLIAEVALAQGINKQNILYVDNPYLGALQISQQIQTADLALLMVLSEREKVVKLLTGTYNVKH